MSGDSPKKQKNFHDKYNFQFTLLCDESHDVLTAYGAWTLKKNYGREYMGIARISYLIDEEGKIAKVYEKVKTSEHPKQALADWIELAG